VKSVLIISPKEDDTRLIRESLPSDYQVENAESLENALNLHANSRLMLFFLI
jgi:hypothetical protein